MSNIFPPTSLNNNLHVLPPLVAAIGRIDVKVLFDHSANIFSLAATAEQDLIADTLAAGELANNGDKIFARYGYNVLNTGMFKSFILRFGGTPFFIIPAAYVNDNYDLDTSVMIIRVSSSVVRCTTMHTQTNTTTGVGSSRAQWTEITGLTLANAQILKLSLQQSAAIANGVCFRMSSVEKHLAA